MAKADGVAQITAAFSTRGGLEAGIIAELRHQISSIVKCCATMDIGGLGCGTIGRIVKRKGHARLLPRKAGATITGNGKRRGDKRSAPERRRAGAAPAAMAERPT